VTALVGGDEAALPRLRELSQSHPAVFGTEVEMKLETMAQRSLANQLLPNNAKLYADLVARMQLEVAELAGDDPSPVRRRCAQWVVFTGAEAGALATLASIAGIQTQSIESSRRLTAAGRRYMTALKALAQITAAEARPQRRARPVS
jgi:hypothetical protein